MKIKDYRDPLLLALDLAQNRTGVLILWELERRKLRDKELEQRMKETESSVFQAQLERMIFLGLVSRIVHARRKPLEIEYALTNRGAKYLKALRKLMDTGIDIMLEHQMADVLYEQGYIEKTSAEEEKKQTV